MQPETIDMFADCFQVLSDLVTLFPVTDDDIIGLHENKPTYRRWLKSGGQSGQSLEDNGNNQWYDNQWYNTVLDKITAWMRIPQSSAAQNIRKSLCKNVYVELKGTDESGGFFTTLCDNHVTLAPHIFADRYGVAEHTQSFVQRVDVDLRRMMEDWTPGPYATMTRARHLDSQSRFLWIQEKLYPLLLRTYKLHILANKPSLRHLYICVETLVGYLPLSEIMCTWNIAVALMAYSQPDKEQQVRKFIRELDGNIQAYDTVYPDRPRTMGKSP